MRQLCTVPEPILRIQVFLRWRCEHVRLSESLICHQGHRLELYGSGFSHGSGSLGTLFLPIREKATFPYGRS